jgi:predicted phosphodiesterase
MRIGILSDIHSNLPALEAVLEDISSNAPDEIWCLGDVVGYGAEPDACARVVEETCQVCLVGNHDLAVTGVLRLDAFSPSAAAAARWTREVVAERTLEFLRGLESKDESRDVALYHASPRDPVWEYVLWTDQAAECMEEQASRISFIGHSHVALFFLAPDAEGAQVRGAQAAAGTQLDLATGRWLINPGSVGQPRDRDPRAAWLELDTERLTAAYHRVEYDVDRAAEAIAATDLPEQLGKRLYIGQ